MSVGVTVAAIVVFVVVFVVVFGVLGLARVEAARGGGTGGDAPGFAQAALCFPGCAAVVAYGICLIVPRFH